MITNDLGVTSSTRVPPPDVKSAPEAIPMGRPQPEWTNAASGSSFAQLTSSLVGPPMVHAQLGQSPAAAKQLGLKPNVMLSQATSALTSSQSAPDTAAGTYQSRTTELQQVLSGLDVTQTTLGRTQQKVPGSHSATAAAEQAHPSSASQSTPLSASQDDLAPSGAVIDPSAAHAPLRTSSAGATAKASAQAASNASSASAKGSRPSSAAAMRQTPERSVPKEGMGKVRPVAPVAAGQSDAIRRPSSAAPVGRVPMGTMVVAADAGRANTSTTAGPLGSCQTASERPAGQVPAASGRDQNPPVQSSRADPGLSRSWATVSPLELSHLLSSPS